ncbi:orotidine-5'-phosphate decarboxylase [Sediminibacillus massiliensis]|uniref:orotidine-5'-phosphate decarboxylase n=1 Tax=Sediminibacillus massiliensis TaxID=1926277 RepID=UPI0009884C26|nr:orotidine-5'-phosphate decarboxylase [Sediminibacillus massiliensis]
MEKPMFLALDFQNWNKAESFLVSNHLDGVPVKIGMELFYKEGPRVVRELQKKGHSIFLDLKLHDIPNTIYRAMRNIAELGVEVVNVHALGGGEMIQAAKEGLMEGGHGNYSPKLIAVTILTSHDEQTLHNDLLIEENIESATLRLAGKAKQNGADGVVCSVHEVSAVKKLCGEDFYTITPGIRLAAGENQDQKRVATPDFARNAGTDAIVIGRSITNAQNPAETYNTAIKEWRNDFPEY